MLVSPAPALFGMRFVVARRAERDQILCVEREVWSVLQMLDVMHRRCWCHFPVASTVLTEESVAPENREPFVFPFACLVELNHADPLQKKIPRNANAPTIRSERLHRQRIVKEWKSTAKLGKLTRFPCIILSRNKLSFTVIFRALDNMLHRCASDPVHRRVAVMDDMRDLLTRKAANVPQPKDAPLQCRVKL